MALRVWLPLNGNLNNQGLSNVSTEVSSATVNSSGKIGSCYACKTGAYLSFNYNITTTNNFSVAFWLKLPSSMNNSGLWQTLLSLSVNDGGTDKKTTISWTDYNNIKIWDTQNHQSCWMTSEYDVWNHYVITNTFNSSVNNIKVYKNGQLVGSYDKTVELKIRSGSITLASGVAANVGPVYFNDVRIYDHALSPKEVYELSKGLIVHYKLDDLNNLIYFDLTNDNYTLTNYLNRTSSYISNGIYHVEGAQQSTSIDTSFTIRSNDYITLEPNSNYYLTFLCNCLSTASIKFDDNQLAYTCLVDIDGTYFKPQESVNIGTLYSGVVLLKIKTESSTKYKISIGFDNPNLYGVGSFFEISNVALYKIDSVVYDCSGYQNNGAITGEYSILSDSKRYSSSIKYLNSDTSIAIGNLSQLCPAGIFTFNIWFKKNTGEWSTKTWETILGGPSGFELETKLSSKSLSYIHPYSWGGGYVGAPNDYSIQYTLDEWHMLTMVRTSSYSKFYLDGELKVTGSAGSIPSGNYYLGAWSTATAQNYRGYLSDFRIYATELSESDILSLYQTSASIDNQQNFYSYEIEDNSTEYSGGLINSGEIFDLTFRETNNGLNVLKDVDTGIAHLENVKGNTVSWNQNISNGNFDGSITGWSAYTSSNISVAYGSNSIIATALKNGSGYSFGIKQSTIAKSVANHRYLILFCIKTSIRTIIGIEYANANSTIIFVDANVWAKLSFIITTTVSGYDFIIKPQNSSYPLSVGDTYEVKNVSMYDLTLIYGAGNEPTSVKQFEADYEKWFGKPLTYEPYNAGELIPAKTTALKTTGFNQLNNGVAKVIGGNAYQITGTYTNITLDGEAVTPDSSGIFTPDHTGELMVSGYSTDTCVHLVWSGTRNGEYEPYEEHTLQLPLTTLTGKLNGEGSSVVVFQDGMKKADKAGTIRDEIYISGGKTYAVKRAGSVDLGSLSWWYNTSVIRFESNLSGIGNNHTNCQCARYVIKNADYGWANNDKVCCTYGSRNLLYVKDTSYTDAATFKAAMQGVMLYYELAEPLVYELDNFTLPATFRVNDYGTELQISNTTNIPAELLISYDIKDKISLIGNETIYGDMIPIESGTYNYSYKYEVIGSNNLFLIGLEYYDTNRNLLSTANQVSSTGALSEKVTSGNVSIPANTKYVRYKIVNDANNNSTSNTSTIYFISLRLDTANPLLIYSTGESICNEFIELDQTSIHDSGITETNNIYEI